MNNNKLAKEWEQSEMTLVARAALTDNITNAKDYGFDLPPRILTCLAAKSMYDYLGWKDAPVCFVFQSIYITSAGRI
jgi:hypothetical protein